MSYIYAHLPVNVIVIPHPRSVDSHDEAMFLAPIHDNQTRKYDTVCSIHYPFLSTLRTKGLSRSKM